MSKIKPEREKTYEIPEGNVKIIDLILQNNKNIIINSSNNLLLNKQNKLFALHLLASENYIASIRDSEHRHRITFKFKKKIKIEYTIKYYVDRIRWEEIYKYDNDFEKTFSILKQIPALDTGMLKISKRYNYLDKLKNAKLRISIDCCYAINLNNFHEFSEPFFYFEIEEKRNFLPEDFCNSIFFNERILPYLRTLKFFGLNKIRKCHEKFPKKEFYFQTHNEFKNQIESIYSHVMSNKKKFDVFKK